MSKNLAPGKEAQYYALLAWNGKTPEEALEIVNSKTYDELNEITYAGDSVESARRGIEKHLMKKGELNMDYITGKEEAPEGYYKSEAKGVVANFDSEEEMCDSIILILEEIHDKWVVDNAKKYDRDSEKNDKRLYQHLPTALIGVDEVAKDLMFLSPILENMGYKVGKMKENEWGEFVPSKEIVNAYQRYVEKYKQKYGITSESELKDHIKNITSTYSSLSVAQAPNGKEDFAQKRVAYMSEPSKVRTLTNSVMSKNENAFVVDQSSLS